MVELSGEFMVYGRNSSELSENDEKLLQKVLNSDEYATDKTTLEIAREGMGKVDYLDPDRLLITTVFTLLSFVMAALTPSDTGMNDIVDIIFTLISSWFVTYWIIYFMYTDQQVRTIANFIRKKIL